jgi:predicted membrane protein
MFVCNQEKKMNDPQQISKRPIEKIRNQVILSLQNAYAHDMIVEQEFEKRLDEATNTNDKNALALLVSDVPIVSVNDNPQTEHINTQQVRDSATYFSVMSGTEKKGAWRPPRKIKIFTVMGGTELDFRKALLAPGITDIKITCVMGGVEIYVPKGINVEVHGFPFMGGLDNRTDDTWDDSAPTLRIHAFVVMGGVGIRTKE